MDHCVHDAGTGIRHQLIGYTLHREWRTNVVPRHDVWWTTEYQCEGSCDLDPGRELCDERHAGSVLNAPRCLLGRRPRAKVRDLSANRPTRTGRDWTDLRVQLRDR